jgi:glucan phosphoethanolaminetransferase (alkaline phosphatase superfamily)
MTSRSMPKRAWWALGALNLFLLSPIPMSEVVVHAAGGQSDKLLLFTIPASVLWLACLHTWVRRPALLHACLFPFYVTVGCDLFLVFHYQTRLTTSSLSVILDNWENAGDYVRTHVRAIVAPTLLEGTFYGLGLFALRGAELAWPNGKARLVPSCLLVLVYGGVAARQVRSLHSVSSGLLDVVSHDRSSPTGVLPQAAIAVVVYRDTIEHERAARSFHFGAHRDGPPGTGRRVVVLVLGESSRADHWGLYGYARATTPLLGARGDVLVFRDVTCQAPLTKLSVPLIITRGDIDHMESYVREKSIVTAYKEAGYETAWLSTQQRDQWTGAINRYTNEADQQRFFERRLDGVLTDELAIKLADTRSSGASLFVVLHTQGSHFPYADRFPPPFRHFSEAAGTDVEQTIATYDDTILYTDTVLSSVITLLEREDAPAAMLYVADHSDNLYDEGSSLLATFSATSGTSRSPWSSGCRAAG